MQIIINLTNLKCSFFYKRNVAKVNSHNIDEELVNLAKRLSEVISPENSDVIILDNVNFEDIPNSMFHCRKSMNLIFKCFDNEIEGTIIRERTIPLTLFFDRIDLGHLNEVITDQNIILKQNDFDHLDTLILE